MKTVKRVLALVLALTLLLAMSATVFAADDTYTITISGDNVVEGHTYEAYQIFKGDLAEKDGKTILSNIEWGSGVNGAALLTALKADATFDNDFNGCTTAAQVADVLATYGSDAGKTQQFAKLAGANLNAAVARTSTWNASGKNYSISSLAPGYYLVKDKDDSAPSSDAYTRYILQVVHNVTVNAKTDVPTVDKNIKEGDTSVKANNASIGDVINYEVKSAVPDMTGYTKYFFVMNDTLSKGLTYNDNMVIKVGDTTLTKDTGYTVTAVKNDNGTTSIEIVFKNFVGYKDRVGADVIVTYSATLNQDANLDPSVGNPNEVKLVYSNNPNVVGTGDTGNPDKPAPGDATGETPKSETKTYVTGIKLTKVDGQNKNQTLTGAKFEIKGDGMKVVLVNKEMYKKSASGTYYMLKNGKYTVIDPVTDKSAEGYNADQYDDVNQKYEKVTDVTKEPVPTEINATGYVDANGVLTFEGLGAGSYTITELVAPNGYNLLKESIKVNITAEAALDKCTWIVTAGSNIVTADSNLYAFQVENNAGAALPSTGGIGTTVFYVLGGLLVVCAGVLLITKRRMNKNA
ncbi:MAG: SpaH/EbpB family LPXTG-anchored major pilin [Clostridiales bacterium]|nr:SpaH/EbpB family LPXTG-anchored major pilin [Clostridiales bacterium]